MKTLYSSHYFSQTQTAQTAALFFNGYTDFFNPAVYFLGKPGFVLLELPVYQYLVAMIARFAHLSLEHSALLLNMVSMILILFCFSFLLEEWTEKKQEKKSIAFLLPLVFSPLLSGVAFWFSIEVFTLALTAASLSCFLMYMKSAKAKPLALVGFCMSRAISLSILPNHI